MKYLCAFLDHGEHEGDEDNAMCGQSSCSADPRDPEWVALGCIWPAYTIDTDDGELECVKWYSVNSHDKENAGWEICLDCHEFILFAALDHVRDWRLVRPPRKS